VRTEVKNRITMLGKDVVAEVASPHSTHRRWISVSPIDGQIQVVEVEVPVGVDPVEYPKTDKDRLVVNRETFDCLSDALNAMDARGIDTDTFDAPWKSENPF
jgi:hypothetical protein